MNRREFLKNGLAVLGVGGIGSEIWAEMAKHPLVGAALPKWEKGHFRITMYYTGFSESSLLVFPDGTSMLIDCGDDSYIKNYKDKRAGEVVARHVLRDNPNGRKVDYFMLSHYHSDHVGGIKEKLGTGRGKNGKYWRVGLGQAIDFLDFDTIIDRSWPDVNDPAPRSDDFNRGEVKHIKEVYAEAERRGTKIEKFRLEKGSDQIRLRHGGSKMFGYEPLCSNGCLLCRDGSVLDLGTVSRRDRSTFGENALSIGLVFKHGDFRYYTAGDFEGAEIEKRLAKECPRVDVAKANHHGCGTMPRELVHALKARVYLAGIWHPHHMDAGTMSRLATATWPCLYAPGYTYPKRRKADARKPWSKDIAPESLQGVHAVVDVAPDGKTYRLMMVSAKDPSDKILGAYDFNTSDKAI